MYDVSDRNSFESLEHWLLEMQNEIGNQAEHENVVVCVCANKVTYLVESTVNFEEISTVEEVEFG